MKRLIGFAAASTVLGLVSMPVFAQDYPVRVIKIVVPFAPGGLQDIEARALGAFMEPRLKQPVVVENRPGAGAAIGIGEVARAAPDGYTLLVTGAGITQLPFLRKDLTFDSTRDLAPISQLVEGITMIVTNRQTPAKTWQEFVAHAKANSGKLNYGGLGPSSVRLAFESLLKAAGLSITEIPYAGQSAYDTALLRNDVQLTMGLGYKGRADSGEVTALLAIGDKRSPHFPNVPTTAEAGYGNAIRSFGWAGFFAPAATPRPIVDRLAAEAAAYVRAPETRKRHEAAANVGIGNTPDEFRRSFDAETRLWGAVAKAINLQPQ